MKSQVLTFVTLITKSNTLYLKIHKFILSLFRYVNNILFSIVTHKFYYVLQKVTEQNHPVFLISHHDTPNGNFMAIQGSKKLRI